MTARLDTRAAISQTGGRVSDADFAAAIAPYLPDARPIAVAVSGGGDSLALLHLMRTWAQARGADVTALTVDHGLRDASAGEAEQVAAWCAGLGVRHATLRWTEGHTLRGLARSPQAAARTARYDLMTGWCRERGIDTLCLAHHADDQVETFLMRLARGSGVDGLAAMAPTTARDGVTLLRPLLSFPKAALLETCRARGQPWIEDPSNANAAATRVRFRQARELLAAEGLTTERLLATVGHMQRARGALETMVAALLTEGCVWDAFGVARLDAARMLAAPEEVALRALAQVLIAASGAEFGPRFEALSGLYGRFARGPWRDATLHGCHIQRDGGEIVVSREAAAIADVKVLAPGESVRWDGRFMLSSPATAPCSFRVSAMTAAAWAALKKDDGMRLSPALRAGLPLLCDEEGPAGAPIVEFLREDVRLALGDHNIQCVFAPRRAVADLPPFPGM